MIFDNNGALLPDFHQLAECWFIADHTGWILRINIKGTDPMHRKFITLIIAAAIAVTGFSTQVRAGDNNFGKTLAGLVVLGIIGAAIHESNKDDKVVSNNSPEPDHYHPPTQPAHQPVHQHPHQSHVIITPRPKPQYVARKTLPRSCLGTVEKGHGKHTEYLGGECLNNTYGSTQNLPRSCKERIWGTNGSWSGYNVNCLENNGYRISHK